MQGSDFDEAEFFRAIAASGARALLIGFSMGGFVARMPGKVIDVRVQGGDAVQAGQTLLILEAMKMEHPMRATEDGVVTEVRVAKGDQVEAGAVLLVVVSDTEKGES